MTNRWQATMRAALAPHGLTHVQYVLLASLVWLSDENAAPTQADLARHAATDPMMTSQVLRALEGKALVTRTAHPTDRRARTLRPTAAGVALARAATASVEAADRDFFDRVADPAFITALRRLMSG